MTYENEAFGGLHPKRDVDAAVKLVLNSVLMDGRLSELAQLLTEGHDVGAIAGEPGWILERRDDAKAGHMPAYAAWPEGARFRARVDPNSYDLAYPEYYMTEADFRGFVAKAMKAYAARRPDAAHRAPGILRLPNQSGDRRQI